MKKNMIAFVLTLFAGVSVLAAESKPVQITLNWKAEPEFGGFYAAALGGHCAKLNLKCEIVEGGASTPTVQMVAAGKIDFAIVSGDEIVLSRANGSDVVALFATYQTDPHGIMVHESSDVKNIKDLLGRSDFTVALQRGVGYTVFLEKKFAPFKAKIVPYTGGIGPFLNNPKFAQQCFVTSEPLAAKRKGKPAKSFLIADEGYNPYSVVLATRSSVLAKNPELVKSVVQAVRDGWAQYMKAPDVANRYMAGLNKAMDMETFQNIAMGQRSLIETEETKKSGLGSMTEARWKTLVDQMAELKLIKKKPEPASLFKNI